MLARRIAKVQRPKNSPKRVGGTIKPAMARPADWLEPMHTPAIAAAHQKTSLVLENAASKQVSTQPNKVKASANLWPMRSCA